MAESSGRASSADSEIIVADSHLRLLLSTLETFGIAVRQVERSSLLGLARVPISDLARDLPRSDLPSADRPADSGPDLTGLLSRLRSHFRARYGWTPTLGKNRLVGHLQGVGEVSFGGVGEPHAVPDGEVSFGVGASGSGDPQPQAGPPMPPRSAGPGADTRVGLIDTALFPHPWLVNGYRAATSDLILPVEPVPAADGHATFLTGLILKEAPGTVVELERSLGDDGQGDAWNVANAIVRIGNSGVDLLNLSFACYTDDREPPMLLATAVARLPRDVVVVAAAGNHGAQDVSFGGGLLPQNAPAWPAALDGVLAVGARTPQGEQADFSPTAPWVDVLADGVDVVSTYLPAAICGSDHRVEQFGGTAKWSGTSFAAATVTGLIAARIGRGADTAREALDQLLSSETATDRMSLPPYTG